MTSACWLAIWIVCFGLGVVVVDRTWVRIERYSQGLGLAYVVLVGPSVPILAWLAADQLVVMEQAGCEELNPAVELLNGMSPFEFRVRCFATQDNSYWLARKN
ncbi:MULTISPECIES: hypothetical protein [unclassified Bradyrhizobium]|uniref:hypothetical protein n=1 Tax=unclassified Bradyrhizobium TaxID=2631580 RepID=UPI0023AF910F|nr:hypothetical protein [Bradyrhizobium sp. CSS354]MDE5464747.1 hypothetical protein [Bradyrhizobium sp. CSS354]